MLAPIILFVFNRPGHTLKTLNSLTDTILAKESDLVIYSDGPRNESDKILVNDVRKIISEAKGFKSIQIVERKKNLGLANSIISGVSKIIKASNKVIVIEDDMIFSQSFLQYMNFCLDSFYNREEISSVSGYSFPIDLPKQYKKNNYLFYRTSSWGWGTWANRWNNIDWELQQWDSIKSDPKVINKFNRGGDDLMNLLMLQKNNKIDSWSIRFDFYSIMSDSFCLYPLKSKVYNFGADGSGVHFKHKTDEYSVILDNDRFSEPDTNVIFNKYINKSCYDYFSRNSVLSISRFELFKNCLRRFYD